MRRPPAAEAHYHEPKAAAVPPNGQRRFTVVVEGAANGDLIHTWSSLCQAGAQPAPNEFKTVYPYVTTVQGNRFRFRGGDPVVLRESLARLFQDKLDGTQVKTYIEHQEEHYRKMTFQDELRLLLQRHRVEFDERYVWD